MTVGPPATCALALHGALWLVHLGLLDGPGAWRHLVVRGDGVRLGGSA